MGIFGGSIEDRAAMVKRLLEDRDLEIEEHHIEEELLRARDEADKIHSNIHAMEDQLTRLTGMRSNPQYEPQWPKLDQQRAELGIKLDEATKKEEKARFKYIEDLEELRRLIKKEQKNDRKAA